MWDLDSCGEEGVAIETLLYANFDEKENWRTPVAKKDRLLIDKISKLITKRLNSS